MPPPEDTASTPIDSRRPAFADWLDLLSQLDSDEGMRSTELRRRDRAIGARVQAGRSRPERWLVAWVEARREVREAPGEASGRHTADAVRLSATLLGAAGLAFGAAAAWGALSFQPQGRINVVAVIGALVALPTLLFAFALLNALPARWRRALPLIGSEPEGGGWLQPARWALRALPASVRDRLEAVFGRGQAIERLAAPVQRWLLLSASQGAAVAFQLGAVAATLALVVFSDLSFGWSTTLRVEPASAHRVTTLLAVPWSGVWPEAVPSLELLEHTRFFRIASEPAQGIAPELFGRWWRFVVAALVVYGLLPRLAFFVFVRTRLRHALVRAMLDAPGAQRLLRRMQDPLVETLGGAQAEAEAEAHGVGAHAAGTPAAEDDDSGPWPEGAVVISWAEAIASEGTPGASAPATIAAGGRLTPRDDLEAASRAASLAAELDRPVAVVVRAFEPPMLEVVDFLVELRRRLGNGREIVIGLAEAEPAHAQVWRRRLATIGDPWLSCTSDVPTAESAPVPGDDA